jgi:hypothetical protein
MQEKLQNSEGKEKQASRSPLTLMLAAVVLLAMGTSLWFLLSFRSAPKPGVAQVVVIPRMGDSEQQYARNVRVENIALSRAENFLHQEVTILNAEVLNGGVQPIGALELSVEFSDEMNQIVLRESRGALGTPAVALAPGERRAIEISFDHIPASWNMQQPAVRVAKLQFAKEK